MGELRDRRVQRHGSCRCHGDHACSIDLHSARRGDLSRTTLNRASRSHRSGENPPRYSAARFGRTPKLYSSVYTTNTPFVFARRLRLVAEDDSAFGRFTARLLGVSATDLNGNNVPVALWWSASAPGDVVIPEPSTWPCSPPRGQRCIFDCAALLNTRACAHLGKRTAPLATD